MRLKVTVVDDAPETWFKGTRDQRDVRTLLLLDAEPFLNTRFKNTLEYTLLEEDAEKIPPGTLVGQVVNLAVRELKPGTGGRLKVSGALDLSVLPKAVAATQAQK